MRITKNGTRWFPYNIFLAWKKLTYFCLRWRYCLARTRHWLDKNKSLKLISRSSFVYTTFSYFCCTISCVTSVVNILILFTGPIQSVDLSGNDHRSFYSFCGTWSSFLDFSLCFLSLIVYSWFIPNWDWNFKKTFLVCYLRNLLLRDGFHIFCFSKDKVVMSPKSSRL